MIFLLKNDETLDKITLKPSENVTKFSLNTNLETWIPSTTTDAEEVVTEVAETEFRETIYTVDLDTNLCTCDNFVLETHYKVYFKQGATNSYEIENFDVDIVYGSL